MSNRFAPLIHARPKDAEAVHVKKPKKEKEAKQVSKQTPINDKAQSKSTKPAQGTASQPVRPAVSTMQLLREKLEAPVPVVEKPVASKKAPVQKAEAVPAPETEEPQPDTTQPTTVEPVKENIITYEQYRKELEANQIALKRQLRAPDTEGVKKLATLASDSAEEFIHLKKKQEKVPAARPATAPVAAKSNKAPAAKIEPAKGKTPVVETKVAAPAVVSSNSTHKRAKGTIHNELLRVRFTDNNRPNNNRPRGPRTRPPQEAVNPETKQEDTTTEEATVVPSAAN